MNTSKRPLPDDFPQLNVVVTQDAISAAFFSVRVF
eukprot:CAMPEP_0198218536 /NCGR_PEP_ID=MMETSP1445-20131203/69844_1 /TAXON_ID=36898 /ORGANISM="Pyramimonas sp., Strain CCMP2087" /LENGTH=34 /DNA_ID= /DNA_START= /DNA_END= /DNA_ORIENTATION=